MSGSIDFLISSETFVWDISRILHRVKISDNYDAWYVNRFLGMVQDILLLALFGGAVSGKSIWGSLCFSVRSRILFEGGVARALRMRLTIFRRGYLPCIGKSKAITRLVVCAGIDGRQFQGLCKGIHLMLFFQSRRDRDLKKARKDLIGSRNQTGRRSTLECLAATQNYTKQKIGLNFFCMTNCPSALPHMQKDFSVDMISFVSCRTTSRVDWIIEFRQNSSRGGGVYNFAEFRKD